MMPAIYLDNNATTRTADAVVAAMTRAMREHWANPSSMHRPGQATRREIELARAAVAELIGCQERELVFTSGGTESVNLAVRGAMGAQPNRRLLVTSRLEHSAVRELADGLASLGVEVMWLGNDERGLVDVDALRSLLAERAAEVGLVSIMWVNNETGVIQPIEDVGSACREFGVRFHTDATQAVGKMAIDVAAMPVDLLSFAAHKFHGPQGTGALYVRRGVRLQAQVTGGPQERRRRGGTENAAGIVGAGVAARLAAEWLASDGPSAVARRRDALERGIVTELDRTAVNGLDAPRIETTTNIAFIGLEAEAILLMLSERGVCASAGAACSSGSMEPSTVLQAMGLPPEHTYGSIRFGLSRETTDDEVERAIEIVVEVVTRLRESLAV
jgi:cysteine desulfurase